MRFPVDAFLDRITQLAVDTAHAVSAAATAAAVAPSAQQSQRQGLYDSSSSSSSILPGAKQQWSVLRSLPPEQVVAAVEHVLFKKQQQQSLVLQYCHNNQQQQWYESTTLRLGFRMPKLGRTNLPSKTVVDHPGVWEDARLGYLNEVLVKKQGGAAALAILYADVMQQLLLLGAVDFPVTFEYK